MLNNYISHAQSSNIRPPINVCFYWALESCHRTCLHMIHDDDVRPINTHMYTYTSYFIHLALVIPFARAYFETWKNGRKNVF